MAFKLPFGRREEVTEGQVARAARRAGIDENDAVEAWKRQQRPEGQRNGDQQRKK